MPARYVEKDVTQAEESATAGSDPAQIVSGYAFSGARIVLRTQEICSISTFKVGSLLAVRAGTFALKLPLSMKDSGRIVLMPSTTRTLNVFDYASFTGSIPFRQRYKVEGRTPAGSGRGPTSFCHLQAPAVTRPSLLPQNF
jgi:hypothetical protein